MKQVFKHPDLPFILSTEIDTELIIKPRLSHFIGDDNRLSYIDESMFNNNVSQAVSRVINWGAKMVSR